MAKSVRKDKGIKRTGLPSAMDPSLSLPGEVWKPVVGWGIFYAVSNLGRVRSLHQTGRFLNGLKVRGYQIVKLRDNGRAAYGLVHRMVLEAFIGPAPQGCEACHCNGDSSDNRLENLRWDTRESNQADRHKHGTAPSLIKRILTAENVRAIRTSPEVSDREWAERFGMSLMGVFQARTGRSWASLDTPPLFKR